MRRSAFLTILITLSYLLLSSALSVKHSEAAYRTSNSESVIEIEDIDIAPTSTPTPLPGVKLQISLTPITNPTPTPQIIQTKKEEPKVFFSFSMSQSDIDFGIIDPTNPVIRTQSISLNPGNSRGISLFAYENHPLQVKEASSFIPDTSCDDGRCSEKISSLWENTLTYGFGFRCESEKNADSVCAQDFNNQESYRQFADVAKKESGQGILKALDINRPVTARIILKTNIPGTQAQGAYTNALVFIAAPTF
jgi:hypothetical protein